MKLDVPMLVSIAAILVMLYALWRVIALKSLMPDGMVGRSWNILMLLVVLFAIGYIIMPFLGQLSAEVLRLVVGLIFLFGAIYVIITIALIHRIIEALRA